MRKLLFRRLLPGLLVILLVCIGALYGLLRSERFITTYMLPLLSKQIGQPITAEQVDLRPLRGLSLKGLRLNCESSNESCPSNRSFTLRIGSLETSYDIWALFRRELHITSLRGQDVHVGITTGLDPSPPTASSNGQESPSTTFTASSGQSGFTVRLSDATLERGSFLLSQKDSPESYRFEQVAISIPDAHSHSDSTVNIAARTSIQSSAVSFEDQQISLAARLHDATLFMPTTIDLDISAGSASPVPLNVSGALAFTHTPYSLTTVTVHKAVARHSLLEALSISHEPAKEFEYELKGVYSLSSPATAQLDFSVNKNTFAHGPAHDLKGTSLTSNLLFLPDRISLSNGSVNLVDNNAPLLSSELAGSVTFSPYTAPSSINVHATLVDSDRIRALLQDISPQAAPAHATPAPAAPDNAAPIRFPLGALDLRIDKLLVQKIEASALTFNARIPEPRTLEKAALSASFSGGGSLTMNATGSLDHTISFQAQGKDVNMIPFAAVASGPQGEILEGSLKSLNVKLSAQGSDIRKTLQGHATLSLSRLIVPSTLQEQIPFNILFLPLDALITVFGGTLNMLLPSSISSISDSIRQTLDDAGRLGIDNSIVDLRFDKGKILLRNVDIHTKNLPDFTFKGSITPEDRLDLTVFIALLKLHLPLPITGTMRTPLPDVMYLGPEVVRGLGLSVGSLAGSAASIVGGASNESSRPPESNAAASSAP